MSSIQQNLCSVRTQIATAARGCARSPEKIRLLAVSKAQPVTAIEEAIRGGQRAFAENYLQEGVEKIRYFAQYAALEWHFIGAMQANKSKLVAQNFDWCHSIDRLNVAQRLSMQRPRDKPALNVLIQINISDEPNKSGIRLSALPEFAASICDVPRLRLRGLMTILATESDYQHQLALFGQMHQAFLMLKTHYPEADTLSMGMSADMMAAINAGSTMVRIGRAIFGDRLIF